MKTIEIQFLSVYTQLDNSYKTEDLEIVKDLKLLFFFKLNYLVIASYNIMPIILKFK